MSSTAYQESRNGIIELHDKPSEVIEQMIQLLYLSRYDDTPSVPAKTSFERMQFNLKLFMAADKYDIPHLARHAETKFTARVNGPYNLQDFISTVRELYEDAPDITNKMREIMVEAAVDNACALFGKDSKDDAGEADAYRRLMMREVPAFGSEVVARLLASYDRYAQSLQGGQMMRCTKCGIDIKISGEMTRRQASYPYCKEKVSNLF